MSDGPLRIGDVIHGFVGGNFGRDHYSCARVEAIGADWVVVRTFGGEPRTATGPNAVAECETARSDNDYFHTCDRPEGE